MTRPLIFLILLFAIGCIPPEDGIATYTPEPIDAEAISALGTELHQLEDDSVTAARKQADIDAALEAFDAAPDEVDSWVWLGRRTAYTTRYRDAIGIYTQGLANHPDSPHLLRHRGHRYLSVREFDSAVADLARAAQLTMDRADEIEPDGQPNAAGIPTSTLKTNIWYHLALAHYFRGSWDEAATAMQQCFNLAENNDMRVAAADWLYMALQRADRQAEADAVIGFVTPELEILENHAYHQRILMYKGLLEPDSLLGDGEAIAMATQGYGVGNWYYAQGDTQRATEIYEGVLATGYWPAFGYIAAEMDLARMRQ